MAIINSHNHSGFPEKSHKCQDYVQALEEERRKIQVFQRELPLCLELVTQAIEACKQQLSGTSEYNLNGQSQCSEQTSSDVQVLEEFIPIKRASSHSDDDQEHESNKKTENDTNFNDEDAKNSNSNDKNNKKSDWLRSVQLWNQTPDPPSNEDSAKKVSVMEVKKNGAFHPFKKEKSGGTVNNCTPIAPPLKNSLPPASTSSTAASGGSKKDEKEGQSRKSRRCWSPELHRRFLQALHQLGGSHIATPKQIRELMKVDGLTNDEVKSHLQKYRLHTRRPTTPSTQSNNHNTQAPQFVVVGGLWMPPDYTTGMATTTTSGEAAGGAPSNGVYAPIATLPPPFHESPTSPKQRQHMTSNSNDIISHNEQGIQSSSPATSSSTHTPAY